MRQAAPIYWIAAFVFAFVIWADRFQLDESVRAQATVVPAGRVQVVKAVDGGVLAQLLVREGDQVEVGQILARLEDVRANARQGEVQAQLAALEVALERAGAEAEQREPDFDQFPKRWSAMVESQRALYQETAQRHSDQMTSLTQALELAQARYELLSKLERSGDTSDMRLLEAENELLTARQNLRAAKQDFKAGALREVAEIESRLYTLQFQLNERANVVEKTTITAPKSGIVSNLKFATLGAPIGSGETLLSISPTQEAFELEIKISPADVGSLQVGEPVSAKLSAFDATVYGDFKGQLILISAEAVSEAVDGTQQTFFKGVARMDWRQNPKVNPDLLRAGMTASVDIITGRRSVLEYLLKPIKRGMGQALTER